MMATVTPTHPTQPTQTPHPQPVSANQLHTRSLLWSAPVAAVAATLIAIPATGADDGPVMCFSRRHTDVACPACGMTRGVASLMRGDLAASWAMHPLAIFFVIQAILGGLALALNFKRARTTWFRWIPAIMMLDIVAMVVVWGVRFSAGTLPLT